MKLYYVLSLKHSTRFMHFWWRPDDKGYTYLLTEAGKYTEKEIIKHSDYYNNSHSTIAIPCDEVDKLTECVISNYRISTYRLQSLGYKEKDEKS